jgi:hypothetical protein
MALLATQAVANVGTVILAKGQVYALDTAQNPRALKRRSDVLEGDTLVTGANGEVQIRFNDHAILALRAGSRLKISAYHRAADNRPEQVLMELLTGGFRTITGTLGKANKAAYQIRTPQASIGIRGTHYEAVISGATLVVGVYQGGVRLKNQQGTLDLGLDSPYSFAQVAGSQAQMDGQLVAPKALSTPLATSSLAPAGTSENHEKEKSAQIQSSDEELLIDNLFADRAPAPTLLSDAQTPAQSAVQLARESNAAETDIDQFSAQFDLTALQDVRLTQAQIRALSANPDIGFVVINDQPSAYRLARYQMATFVPLTLSQDVRFDLSLGALTFPITVSQSSGGNINALITDINAAIESQMGQINGIQIRPPIFVIEEAGSLVFQGISTKSGQSLTLSNLAGADVQAFVTAIGLCDNLNIDCTGTYDNGLVSIGQVDHATRFGYLVKGDTGPVFVNFDNDSTSPLKNGFASPDTVLRGNANAIHDDFAGVDVTGDGGNDIEWGQWNTSATHPALMLKDATNLNNARSIAAPFYYVNAIPAPAASRVGVKTFGNASLPLDSALWHASSSTGQIVDFSAQLAVDFGTAEAVGSLSLANATDGWYWDVTFSGQIKDAQFSSAYGYGTLETATGAHDVTGQVDGLFIGSGSGLGFVGGFGLQSNDDAHGAQGMFVIKN